MHAVPDDELLTLFSPAPVPIMWLHIYRCARWCHVPTRYFGDVPTKSQSETSIAQFGPSEIAATNTMREVLENPDTSRVSKRRRVVSLLAFFRFGLCACCWSALPHPTSSQFRRPPACLPPLPLPLPHPTYI